MHEKAHLLLDNPLLKGVHCKKHIEGAKASALNLGVDAAALPHTKHRWMGPRPLADVMVEDGNKSFEVSEPLPLYHLDTSLGGILYMQAEVDTLSGTVEFMYIAWLGNIALLSRTPCDEVRWKAATDRAAALLDQRLARIHLSDERLHHRRAQDSFLAIRCGLSHGGGQIEPRELCNNVSNTQLTDELLADLSFQRLASFANFLFPIWDPILFAFYKAQMALLAAWNPRPLMELHWQRLCCLHIQFWSPHYLRKPP
ncbi:hypothetical protein B0H14DRAFT_3477059 [Mycena olivaceomarginata]|nr:hypothetical protein B0H14DRAFT_3477059 [Mycena olivaceomarginata]